MKQMQWIILFFTALFLLSGCEKEMKIESSHQTAEQGLLPTLIIKDEPIPRMELVDRMKQYNVPGVSIAVINNGAIEWAQGYGVVEAGSSNSVIANTLFQAASISKIVTAMLVLSFVQAGELDLDEDVNQYLHSWKIPENQFTQKEKVTLRRILSHSAGLTVEEFLGYPVNTQIPTLVRILDGQKPAVTGPVRVVAPPGSVWHYSGGGYVIVQKLLEDMTGKPFPVLAKERIFDRLGMTNSTFEQLQPQSMTRMTATGHWPDMSPLDGRWHTYPEMAAAGLWTTPSDLARLGIELQQATLASPSKVLSPEMAHTLLTPLLGNSGLGAFIRGNRRVTWIISGGSNTGFRCFMTVFMENGQGVVVMTNSGNGHYLAMEIIRGISEFFKWPDFLVEEKKVAKIDPIVYDRYQGEYEFVVPQGLKIFVTKEGHKLFADLFGSTVELYPESETTYFELNTGMVFSFVTDALGMANELILTPPLASQQWRARRMN